MLDWSLIDMIISIVFNLICSYVHTSTYSNIVYLVPTLFLTRVHTAIEHGHIIGLSTNKFMSSVTSLCEFTHL